MTLIGLDLLGASTPAPSLADVRAGRAVIWKGMTGEAVTYVQALVGVIADGNFGDKTKVAVEDFQRKNGITADGFVGPSTMAALDRLAGGQGGVSRADFSTPDATSIAPTTSTALTVPAAIKASLDGVPTWKLVLGGLGAVALGFGIYEAVS